MLGQKSLKEFLGFLIKTKTPKGHFKIDWSLGLFMLDQVQIQILIFVDRSSKFWKLIECHELELQVDHCSSWPSSKFKFKFCFLWIGVPNFENWLIVMNWKFKLTIVQVDPLPSSYSNLFFVDRSSKFWKLIEWHELEMEFFQVRINFFGNSNLNYCG